MKTTVAFLAPPYCMQRDTVADLVHLTVQCILHRRELIKHKQVLYYVSIFKPKTLELALSKLGELES